jgi:hypothetical protein
MCTLLVCINCVIRFCDTLVVIYVNIITSGKNGMTTVRMRINDVSMSYANRAFIVIFSIDKNDSSPVYWRNIEVSFFNFSWGEYFGSLLLGCSVISVSFIIFMLTLLLMPLPGLHFCVGLDFVTTSL